MNNIEFDKRHIWHPYASASAAQRCYEVIAASGVELSLASGEKVIDGMSSWWASVHGYNHPQLNQAAHQQIDAFSHVMFSGLTHQPAIDLCGKLIQITPAGLNRVFLADSASVSIEIAIKMALQYWACQGRAQKAKLIALRNGHHGDTFAAMSVSDPITSMHSLFQNNLFEHFFAPAPQTRFGQTWNADDVLPIREILEQHHHEIAALILEPVVQGAGGMRLYHPEYVKACRQLCDEFNILLICDETSTGFGRTGKLFACEHAQISPDILCLGKALTAGYMTMAATLCTDDVAEGTCAGEPGVFMHGPSHMANPLACAVANANIDLICAGDWKQQVTAIETQMLDELLPLAEFDSVEDVRVLGAIGVVEMKQALNVAKIQKLFVQQGVWIRPLGKLICIMPPYIISASQLTQLSSAIYFAIEKLYPN